MQQQENTQDVTPLETFMKLLVIIVRVNYKERTAPCPINKASTIGFSFSFLFIFVLYFPGDISDFFPSIVTFWKRKKSSNVHVES